MEQNSMQLSNRKTVFDNLKKYDSFCKEDDYIEISEWANGEGWSIDLNGNIFNLTYGQLDAVNHLINVLRYGTTTK